MAGRRVQKIVSVSAGFASARFNLHMASQPFDGDVRLSAPAALYDSRSVTV